MKAREALAEYLASEPLPLPRVVADPPTRQARDGAGDAPAMFQAVCDVLREAIGLIAQDPDRPLVDRCAEATRVIRDRGL